jgi:membrane-associated protease RseP (regulator of RpoE activity)
MHHPLADSSRVPGSPRPNLPPALMDHPRDEFIDSALLEPVEPAPLARPARPQVMLPLVLFVATCVSTYMVGGFAFSAAVMTILLAHEFGHYLQAVRYGVPASLPFFIPMPISPIGTMGAVIGMQPGRGDLRSLFDIGITGPIAGLIPSVIFSVIGLQLSEIAPVIPNYGGMQLGEPLFFQFLAHQILGPVPPGYELYLHPIAYAGWVGIFLTALNLFPIGQLDGGHVLYALLLKRAHVIARAVLLAVMFGVFFFGYWGWSLMIFLLILMGPEHPPTANDHVPLGPVRTALGWASLLFVPLGFTPVPFAL